MVRTIAVYPRGFVDSFICKYTYLLTFVCNPSTPGSFLVTCRHAQGGKILRCVTHPVSPEVLCLLVSVGTSMHLAVLSLPRLNFFVLVGDLAVDMASGHAAAVLSGVLCREGGDGLKERITLIRSASFRVELQCTWL